MSYGHDGETTWPVIEPDPEGGLEWRLRYAPDSIDRRDQLLLASIVAAYSALTNPWSIAPREKFARARRAVRSVLDAHPPAVVHGLALELGDDGSVTAHRPGTEPVMFSAPPETTPKESTTDD